MISNSNIIIILIVLIWMTECTYSLMISNPRVLLKRRIESKTLVTSTISSSVPSLPLSSPSSSLYRPKLDQIAIARLTIIGLLSIVYLNTSEINNIISVIWDQLRTNRWFMHDLFEPFIAVSSFFVWIHSFYFAEKNLPGMIQYRLSKNTTVSTTNDNSLSPWYSNWLFRELPLYLGPLYFLSIHFDAFKFRRMALSQSAPSIFRILREILGGLFLYDFFFFFTHFPLHNLGKTVYKHMHARHHSNKEVRAVDTIKLSTVEEFIDVACSIIGLRILNAHPISRTLYNIVITGLLAELHCGYDLPLSPQNIVPFGLWAGSKRHHIHHRNGNVYFQKFFTYLDNGFGLVEKEKVLKY